VGGTRSDVRRTGNLKNWAHISSHRSRDDDIYIRIAPVASQASEEARARARPEPRGARAQGPASPGARHGGVGTPRFGRTRPRLRTRLRLRRRPAWVPAAAPRRGASHPAHREGARPPHLQRPGRARPRGRGEGARRERARRRGDERGDPPEGPRRGVGGGGGQRLRRSTTSSASDPSGSAARPSPPSARCATRS
jgi:hypothetical protein